MILDPRTFLVMAAVFAAISGCGVLALGRHLLQGLRKSAGSWAHACFLLAISWALFAFDDSLADLATVLGANLCYLLAAALIHRSVLLFDGDEPNRALLPLTVLPAIATTVAARYLFDDFDLRVVVMSLAVAIPFALAAKRLLLNGPTEPREFGRRPTGLFLAIAAAILLFRVGVTLVRGAPEALADDPVQSAGLAVGLVSMIGVVYSYFLLYTGRVTGELHRQANRDTLTGLSNRRGFETGARREIPLANSQRRPLALFLVDADQFKFINDEWGHAAGDAALRLIADTLRANLRSGDIVARVGGDEFAVLLPDLDEPRARGLVERVHRAISACPFPYPVELRTSIGVAMLQPGCEDIGSLLAQADRELYAQKRQRKNIILSSELEIA